jgi:hypothetical protein
MPFTLKQVLFMATLLFSMSWRAFVHNSLHVVSSIHMPPFYYWPNIPISFGYTNPSSKFVEDIEELLQKLLPHAGVGDNVSDFFPYVGGLKRGTKVHCPNFHGIKMGFVGKHMVDQVEFMDAT